MKLIIRNFYILLSLLFANLSEAKTYSISPDDDLQNVVNNSVDGDMIKLSSGYYSGNFVIDKSISLNCQPNAIIDGGHTKDAIRIKAKNVIIKNCSIINWGDNLTDMNAGLFIEKTARNILIENNYFKGDTFGMWLDSTPDATIINNRVEGNLSIRSQDRGNGIHLFNVSNALVKNNEVWHTRDGIYIDTSNNNQLIGNRLHDLRYGIHYMFSYSNRVEGNHTFNTRTGYALMQSKYLTVVNNKSENDSNYGILMNYIVHSTISGNQVINTKQPLGIDGKRENYGAEGKAFFIYNAPFNDIHNNLITQSDIGIHLTAGSEGNKIYANYFVKNRQQVKYVANRKVEWSFENKGNFWSDYQGWDRDANGFGDEPFEPNDGIDKILWKYPAANILINSPAVQTLRWVQKEFPVLKSPGITDSHPKMKNDFLKK